MTNFSSALIQLLQERSHLTAQLDRIGKALAALKGSNTPRKRRRLSAAAVARIRSAQKARWAKWRKTHKKH